VHLVDFIMRICQDARACECQIPRTFVTTLCSMDLYIVNFMHSKQCCHYMLVL